MASSRGLLAKRGLWRWNGAEQQISHKIIIQSETEMVWNELGPHL